MTKQGIISENDDTIIVSGGQQGIDLAAKSLINPGDGVICEQPSFVGGLNAFKSNNAVLYLSLIHIYYAAERLISDVR